MSVPRAHCHSLEELTLGSSGITKKQKIDVTTDAMLAVDVFGHTAKPASNVSECARSRGAKRELHAEKEGSFNVIVAVDGRRYG
jgi:hypothetical protein